MFLSLQFFKHHFREIVEASCRIYQQSHISVNNQSPFRDYTSHFTILRFYKRKSVLEKKRVLGEIEMETKLKMKIIPSLTKRSPGIFPTDAIFAPF
jgi:hypothetical protein